MRRWKAAARKHGEAGVRARAACGRPPKLTPAHKRRLEALLIKGPLATGFDTDLWTCPRLSVIGALAISPRRHRVRAHFSILAEASFDDKHVLQFLRQLCRTLRVPIALIWDRLQAHVGEPVKGWLEQNRHRIRAQLLPAYAPELNPVELIWSHAKTNGLANFAPVEVTDLAVQAHLTVLAIGDDELLLRSFLRHCPLSFRLR